MYEKDIIELLEQKQVHIPRYMDDVQTDINAKMRGILIDWLYTVKVSYNIQDDTIFMCINIVDRYLSKIDIPRKNLQLVGVTSLFIAVKCCEACIHPVSDFTHLCKKIYTADQILEMEQSIVKTLDFAFCVPTVVSFLPYFSRHISSDGKLLQYLTDITLPSYNITKYPPSHVAAAIVMLYHQIQGDNEYSLSELNSCVEELKKIAYLPYQKRCIFEKVKDYHRKTMEGLPGFH